MVDGDIPPSLMVLLTVDMSKGAIILALKNKNKFEDIFETPPYVYIQGGLFII